MSMLGGLLLIISSFLPYGYDGWASESTFDLTKFVFEHLTDNDVMRMFLELISPSLGESAFLVALVVAAFLLLFIGGILGLLKTGGGSIAGPAAMVILTLIPIYLGDTGEIASLGSGYALGWIGAAVCFAADMGKHKEKQKKPKKEKTQYDQYYDESYGTDFEPYDSDDAGGDDGDGDAD